MIITIIITIISPIMSQYVGSLGPRADVRFGEHNDRFDLTDIINYQNRHYKDNGLEHNVEYDEFGGNTEEAKEFRRKETRKLRRDRKSNSRKSHKHLNRMKKERQNHLHNLANQILLSMVPKRRFGTEDFADHDNKPIDDAQEKDFERNLTILQAQQKQGLNYNTLENDVYRRMESFVNKLHGLNSTRRVADPEREILFHYAFPIDMKLKGFLRLPTKKIP